MNATMDWPELEDAVTFSAGPHLLGACGAGLAIVFVVLARHLRRYRIDIGPGQSFTSGASMIWIINVLKPANYTSAGRKRVTGLYLVLLAQLVLLTLFLTELN